MNKKTALNIINKNSSDYNKIAKEFSRTRSSLWKELIDLNKYVKEGSNVLDLGCGNGRLYEIFKNKSINYIGVDSSCELIKEARLKFLNKENNLNFFVKNALNLDFANESFDAVYAIAMFHHIPSKSFRKKVLDDMYRILKPKGFLIMTNWNLYNKKYFSYIIKYTLLKLILKTNLDFKDTLIPWQKSILRYYHAFTKSEINTLLKKSKFKVLDNYYVKKGKKSNLLNANNIITIAQKVI